MARRLSFCCLLLFAFAGSTVAQNDPQYVIKRRTDAGSNEIHYLAHVKVGDNWVLQDAVEFNPNCVWYSGNTFDQAGINHNYYFIDNGVYHFLYAPLAPQASLHVSDSLPSPQLLRNSEQSYYFWDWDWDNSPVDGGGVARGIQHLGIPQQDCGNSQATPPNGYSWGGGECWEVYWVEYNNDLNNTWGWRLSSASHYTLNNTEDPVPGAARFRKVTVIPHDIVVTEVTQGELDDLADFTLDAVGANQGLSMSASTYSYSYIPAYTTYVFEGGTHNYFNNLDQGEATPAATTGTGTPSTYTWTITGPGAEFLSFSSTPGSNVTTFEGASSTLYYSSLNETGHKTATLTITVTYTSGITQVRTATVTVKTPCGNPLPVGNPEVVYDYVTVSWVNTADEYKIGLRKNETGEPWKDTIEVSNVSSYTFSGLEYETAYQYRVTAKCNGNYLTPPTESPYVVNFTTLPEPDLLVYGSVFGGGRMADVSGKTEVIIINCDTIGAVYGGNDIAGSVLGLDGSNIVLGVNQNDTYATAYNSSNASVKVRVNDVYGGGNGYYSYNGTSFETASSDYTSQTVAAGGEVKSMTQSNQIGDVVWTNEGNDPVTLAFPTIVKAAIKVTNDQVKVDSLFGGAKNAFLTHIIGYDVSNNNKPIYASVGDTIAINGGTLFAVYGGNNIGGSQGYGKHRIHVTQTTTRLEDSIVNTATTGFGRDFGIRYLFGGGNKVAGSTTNVTIVGGQMDTIFGGGNEADVYAANITVNCELGDHTGDFTYGNTYTSAINPSQYTSGTIGNKTIDTANYKWDGLGGIYNVRTLFGGSNQAAMNGVPTVNLTSGSIGTVYGGGNAGDMLSHRIDSICLADDTLRFKYGTHVVMNSPTILVDYLYGGCQVSNVDFSTWVEIQNGHVGYVYGGCNVSGDVGSTRVNTELAPLNLDDPNVTPEQKRAYCLEYQQVQGATYVVASGGVIYKNLFAGSNGYYHCNDNVSYIQGTVTYGDAEGKYIGLTIPTHNETHAIVRLGANVKGNVYAGGNLACVGFTTQTVGNTSVGFKPFPSKMVGLASVRMDGGTVRGDVYGGGNMASIFGSNEVQVSGGIIGGALYGGNDKLGMVAQPTNRALPDKYFIASDGNTPLTDVKTYVSVTGRPDINTVYGGGNGDYVYTSDEYCDPENLPIQRDIFVDINIDGYTDDDNNPGGHIQTVYGGGNGVTINGKTTVFLNVKGKNGGEPEAYDHVDTIFGGNNKGHLNILADIILLKGQVNTVYGGCNKGAMIASENVIGIDNTVYPNVGSVVRLRDRYTVTNTVPATPVTTTTRTTGRVSGTVYGGCRMNGVNNNSLVLVEGGIHGKTINNVFQYATIYAGSDISGDVGGLGQVVISEDTENDYITKVGDVYGGGNGNYNYTFGAYQGLRAPYCDTTHVVIKSGTVNNLFAGGYAGECGGTTMQLDGGTVNEKVFGGGNMAGLTTSNYITTTTVGNQGQVTINTNETTTDGTSTVTVNNGEVKGGIFGGCNLQGSIAGPVNVYIYGGTLGTSTTAMTDGIFGGGYGKDTETVQNVTVTINKPSSRAVAPTIYGDVYGGSALGQVNTNTDNLTKVDFIDGNLYGNLYGGGMGNDSDSTLVNGDVQVNIIGGKLYNNIYGGCNYQGGVTGDIAVNVNSGQVGTNDDQADVFGGGYGHLTATSGNVTVTVDKLSGVDAPVIYGDVYGGSGYGDVNSPKEASNNSSDDITTVDILNGTIHGDIYGGGLGRSQIGDDPTTAYPAKVNGKVYVNIGRLVSQNGCTTTLAGNATIDGAVYGCNNINGTPLDSVFVNIYKTAHVTANQYPETPSGGWHLSTLTVNANPSSYALSAVYGGGNKAAYLPPLNDDDTPKCTTVHVWGCQENTIYDVYGGGNAADVGVENGTAANTRVIIDGGRIHRMFGGGNGYSSDHNHDDPSSSTYNPGANIYGKASSHVYAGLIDEVYGGANQWGSIDDIDLNVLSTNCCTDAVYIQVFGCANEAPINHSIVTTIGCGVGEIGDLYGGSNLARIGVDDQTQPKANVTLNLYGGNYQDVFGGSKGRLAGGGLSAVSADIYGDVTLNLYGGTVVNAFGGCDQLGSIKGIITVNVLDDEDCGLDLTNVYGGSKLADYDPWTVNNEKVQSPIVNVMHIHNVDGTVVKGIRGNVYGGGYQATVNANPVVNIGYDPDVVVYGDTTMEDLIPEDHPAAQITNTLTNFPMAFITGNVFGGGDLANVTGKTTVNLRQTESQSRVNSIFGGGNEADINSSEVNILNGTVATAVYGGCNTKGNVVGDIDVNIYGGTLGTSTASMPEGIFGGGRGGYESSTNQGTKTTGNITVTIDKPSGEGASAPVIYADVYGGSAFGQVGASGKLTKVDLKDGTIYGTVYGGGKGDDSHTAEVTGNAQLAIASDVTDGLYGGCNVKGIVKGNTIVGITDGTIGVQNNANRGIVYGGGLGENTKVKGNVALTVNGSSVNIYGDVYGGSAKGLVNCNEEGSGANTGSKTDVTLTDGTIHGDLYGGGHGPDNKIADVWGPVAVEVNGGTVDDVFGGNNLKGAPKNTVTVTVNGGQITNVFGGGNVAAYTAPSGNLDYPYVTIAGGTVTNKVVGGGNNADITGNPRVLVTGGTIGTDDDAITGIGKGIYGGCNSTGEVTGNTTVTLTGGTVGVSASNKANIHGGGYGDPTNVTGNVTVNFGAIETDDITGEELFADDLILYGDVYGGSALGDVNTANTSGLKTTVNLLNGTIHGAAYGGGLGQQGSGSSGIAALVYGEVHVNVGRATDANDQDTFEGMADLEYCDIYGGNNLNGSPKKAIYVDVYKTYHTEFNEASYIESGATFAIDEVFGGGNQSNYVPTDLNNKTNVYLHLCENTVRRVFGGGNAAHVPGINLYLDGGRYDYVFGGGNGEVSPANVGTGGIYLRRGGGRIHQLTNGSNDQGTVTGPIVAETVPICEENMVEDYFLGNNLMDLNADIETTIYCGDGNNVEMKFVNLYCGSNKAQIHGNINVTIEGGVFDHVFGGSKGDLQSLGEGHENFASNIDGNVNLFITGGTIGTLYGGCDVNGNITGKINIEVYENENSSCPLFIGDIYGAGNHTNYTPTLANLGGAYSPKVKVLKGTIGGTSSSLPVKEGNPSEFAGNVFGGGNIGNVTSKPKVIVGDGLDSPVTIKGDVYGGGNHGNVTGDPLVIVVPETHSLTFTQTENTSPACQVKVLNSLGTPLTSPVTVGEDLDLRIKAIPSVYNGYGFINWTIEEGAGSSVDAPTSTSTIYTMGTENSILKANFATNLPTHTLTVTQGEHGSFTVKDGFNNALTGQLAQGVLTSDPISEGAVLYLEATPAAGYKFDGWVVTGTGASVGSTTSATTTFTMGTGDATITATYSLVRRRR